MVKTKRERGRYWATVPCTAVGQVGSQSVGQGVDQEDGHLGLWSCLRCWTRHDETCRPHPPCRNDRATCSEAQTAADVKKWVDDWALINLRLVVRSYCVNFLCVDGLLVITLQNCPQRTGRRLLIGSSNNYDLFASRRTWETITC